MFDKEEDLEESENINADNIMVEDVEPPGYLLDIQKEPVEGKFIYLFAFSCFLFVMFELVVFLNHVVHSGCTT